MQNNGGDTMNLCHRFMGETVLFKVRKFYFRQVFYFML